MRSVAGRIRIALNRPRLWRVTAAVSALLLCGVLVVVAQGSLDILAHRPPRAAVATGPAWERFCSQGEVRRDRQRLAYCARIEGLVVATTHGPAREEVHVAVVGDFHFVVIRLKDGSRTPSLGSRFAAVGPLLRARDGQRELQAFKVLRG